MQRINIGLIDFGYRSRNLNSMVKLDDVINYAIIGEKLGFDKLWIGEHHMPKRTLPWNNPTNLIPILASHTQSCHVGTAGTLMCIHNPYHVASAYKFFNNIFPGRIDLGFANGTPYNGVATHSTGRSSVQIVKDFEIKVRQTVNLLKNEEEFYQKDGLVLPPYKGILPELWTLSSSQRSMNRAIELGTNLAFWVGNIFKPEEAEKFHAFKNHFFDKFGIHPKIRAVVNGTCHTSQQKAKAVAKMQKNGSSTFCGDSSMFYDLFYQLSEYYGICDFMFFNEVLDPKDRLIGIEHLSHKLNLYPSSEKTEKKLNSMAV